MAGRALRRTYRPGFADDVKALPTRRLQEVFLQRLVDISAGRLSGQPLDSHASTGDLTDCRKLYFDERGTGRPRCRLVYRLLPDEVEAVEVQAMAAGLRQLMEVYVTAARRLGRLPQDKP